MHDIPKTRIRPETVIAFTSSTSVLLLLVVLLFPVVIAMTAAGHTGAVTAAANRQPLPTIPPEVAPPAIEVEANQPPLPTIPPEVAPPAVEVEDSHPSPRIIPSAPGSPTPSPSSSASEEDIVASPTPELDQASDPSQEPAIYPPGSITVRLWACQPGYNPFTSGANLISDCVTLADREVFSLTMSGQSGTRDDRTYMGILTFDGLGPGTYMLSHSPPFLTAYSIPLGCTTQTAIATATPPVNALALAVSLVSISLPLAQNQAIVCDWYDVPRRRSAFPPESDPSVGPVERAP